MEDTVYNEMGIEAEQVGVVVANLQKQKDPDFIKAYQK